MVTVVGFLNPKWVVGFEFLLAFVPPRLCSCFRRANVGKGNSGVAAGAFPEDKYPLALTIRSRYVFL